MYGDGACLSAANCDISVYFVFDGERDEVRLDGLSVRAGTSSTKHVNSMAHRRVTRIFTVVASIFQHVSHRPVISHQSLLHLFTASTRQQVSQPSYLRFLTCPGQLCHQSPLPPAQHSQLGLLTLLTPSTGLRAYISVYSLSPYWCGRSTASQKSGQPSARHGNITKFDIVMLTKLSPQLSSAGSSAGTHSVYNPCHVTWQGW